MLQKYTILQYLPLTLFVWLVRFKYDWPAVFISAGVCAFIFLLILLRQKNVIDRFVLAIYCFLMGGAAMFIFNVTWLQFLYQYFDKAMLLTWLFVVGILSMITTATGFIGVESVNKEKRNLYSYYLLIGVAVGLCVALYNRENILLAGMLPFLSVRILQIILKILLRRQK